MVSRRTIYQRLGYETHRDEEREGGKEGGREEGKMGHTKHSNTLSNFNF